MRFDILMPEKDETETRPSPTLFDLIHRRRQTTKARVVDGRATDKSRSIDGMLAPRAAAYRSAWNEHRKPAYAAPTPSPQDLLLVSGSTERMMNKVV